jgi:hypothetical protein
MWLQGLTLRFPFDSLFAAIDSLALYGGIHSIHLKFHRLPAKRFPYAIYYKIIDNKLSSFGLLIAEAIQISFVKFLKKWICRATSLRALTSRVAKN